MMNIYRNILSKIVNFQYEDDQLMYLGNTDFDHLTLLNDFEKELIRLMLTENIIVYYGDSKYYFDILNELFTFDTHNRLITLYTNYNCDSLFDKHIISYIMNECEDLIFYYEYTDNV